MAIPFCSTTIFLHNPYAPSPRLRLNVSLCPSLLRRLNFIRNKRNGKQPPTAVVLCSASPGNRPPSADISASAKIRSEVLSPFRSVRMFFYLAFMASGGLGSLIALTRLIAALRNTPNSGAVPEILEGLGIDLAAVSLFAFLYTRDLRAQKVQLAKLSREETLANLKLEVDGKRVVSMSQLRGFARLVIVAGPATFIEEAFKLSEPFTNDLFDRGVRVVYYATDGLVPKLQSSTVDTNLNKVKDDEQPPSVNRQKNLWQLTPIYTSEWSKWLNEQKSLAKVPEENPVYISLRMDGRVRGSGVGYPPWNAFVAQLPPLKGLWGGVLDGMDGRI